MSENLKYVTPQFKKIFNPKIGLFIVYLILGFQLIIIINDI